MTNVIGTDAPERLQGTAGAERVAGLGGNDTIAGLGGPDTLDGGNGFDVADFQDAVSGVTVDLAAGRELSAILVSVEGVLGSASGDVLTGDAGGNLLQGAAGDDLVQGRGGDDTLDGGAGSNVLDGGTGADTLVYDGNRSDLAITATTGGFRIVDQRPGGGTDLVSDVEVFQFSAGGAGAGELLLPYWIADAGDAIEGQTFSFAVLSATVAPTDTVVTTDRGSVTIPAGQSSAVLEVAAPDDAIFGRNPDVVVALTGAFGTDTGIGRVLDNEVAPTYVVAATTAAATEGAAGAAGALVFTVTRSVATNTDETATFGLGGTAAAGADYVAPAGSVTFAAGETSREIAIATTGDSLAEGDETLTMALTGATGGGQVSADPAAGTIVDATPTTPLLHVSRGGVPSQEPTTVYDGPVSHLQFQYLGTASAEVVVATASDDFLNLLGGDDAGAGGPGADVLDGGTGSNFLSGGAGQDVFFVDGRDGATTWSTVTDWQAGEQLSVWGWRPGVSQATWVDSAGTEGFRGVTMHGDLDGDGTVDTSVTWSGVTRVQLPAAVEFEGLLWFK